MVLGTQVNLSSLPLDPAALSVTQPKRTFTTVRTPKDIASENSISRYVAAQCSSWGAQGIALTDRPAWEFGG